MTPIRHTFVSPVVDNADPDKVGPDEWNADHTMPDWSMTFPLWLATTAVATTWNVNNLNHVAEPTRCFHVDFDAVQWTHFRLRLYGSVNEASQNVGITIVENSAGFPSFSGGTDLTLNSTTAQWWDSDWRSITSMDSGFRQMMWSPRGSTATIDINNLRHLSITFRRV